MSRPAVVVVGSGAAGLAAALAAANGGAEVVVVESSDLVGGTTSISGGVVWAPANHLMDASTRDDDRRAAARYLDAIARGDKDPELMYEFVVDAGRVVSLIEERTAIRWSALEWPDYHEADGSCGGGRSIWPRAAEFDAEVARQVQPSPEAPAPRPDSEPGPLNDAVVFRGPVRGRVLVAAMLDAALGLGVEVRTGSRATKLCRRHGAVSGVVVGGETLDGRVVLATGGFQHDVDLVTSNFAGAPIAPMGTPGCSGDGLRMSMSVDATLGNMAQGWWMPAFGVPGEELDGAKFFRPLHGERAQPGAIMVDRCGRRFVNEARNYGDVGAVMRAPARGDRRGADRDGRWPADPCWMIFDANYRSRYPVGPLLPKDPDPDWLVAAEDLEGLARSLALAPAELAETVQRFNEGASRGEDAQFGRGSNRYDRWIGDGSLDDPTLAPLRDTPIYALAVNLGCLGTKGGPRTDAWGRVRAGGGTVRGLYAAGNAAASPFGDATPAGGGTIGPALVFGTRAGEAAVGDP